MCPRGALCLSSNVHDWDEHQEEEDDCEQNWYAQGHVDEHRGEGVRR